MRNSRPKKRGRPAKAATSESRYTYTSKVNRFEDEEDEESNHSSSTTNTSTSKYQTRASRKPSYRIGITIERKKSRRGRRKDAESEEDDYIVDDEYEEPAHHPNSEEESQNSDDDNSAEDDELVEEDEEEVEESEEDEAVSKKRLRPVREAPAALFLDDAEVPELTLPASSEDLLISGKELMRALSIYEILRHFQNTLRLTPFRFEDFCVALLIDEQTYLLSEIHIQLLKALIREDDLVGTQHGPQDLRDSISIYLFLCDHLTWPEVMRIYMSSDLKKNSRIITEYLRADYPFSSLHNKLALLEHFCDEFLNSQSSREVLNNEGIIKHEDNCRVCHRPGDLLCCETCPAVFHLHCLDPPLKQVPTEEWICPICKLNSVTGVTDCMSEYEKNGVLSRQEPLGWDRHGRSYWFLCRRLIVEDNKEESKVAYYSTRLQFDELLSSLDEDNYEKDLCKALEEMKEEIYRQMAITEKLTKTAKGSRKSYLEVVNEELFIKRSARLKMECEQNGDEPSAANSANEEKYAELESKLAVDEDDLRGGGVQTRLKTGTLQPKSITLDPFKNRVNVYNSINTFREEETVIIVQEESGTLTRTPRKALPANFNQINLFKLGMEGNYRQYQNIYVVNQYALSKFQQADDRDKKRHLSHKFSLTQASELKWASYTQINTALMTTTMHGTKSMLINILRQALLYLETQFSQTFMHPNWQVHRVNWIKAVSMCSEAKEFALALHILESSMKPVLFNSAWHETLGFCVLQRSTQLERDELKKKDKKDRRDQNETATIDSEATASRYYSAGIGIKLVFGKLKHQIWKQKGEEYRLSGIGGWHWLSSTRTRPEVSEAPTVEREWEPPEMNSADSALIDITKDLQQKELPSRKAYPKMYKSCKLDTLLKSRIDMHNLAEKKKRQASLEKDGKSGGAFTGYRCYSPCCDPSTSAEARCFCYSPLCCFDSQKEKLAEESESFGDTTEHVDLMQVTLVDGVQAFVKKLIPFNAKGQLPPSSRFSTGQYKNILILPTYEMRKLGRNGGLREVTGFNYNCKINNSVWPYGLTPRPYFRTIWLLRTHYLNNLHSAALQLRVFWASIRWDDLATKPPPSGTNTITTESEVQTIEILKRRDLPPFGLRSEYLTRKIIVPIDLPVKQREVSTPIRSGLRERRRPESPQVKGPRMEELWINEEDIELWEIRQFGEKAEKQQQLAKQRAAQEEKQKQLELLRKKNEDQRRLNNEQSAKVVNGSININPSKSITSRLTSIFQNRVGNKIITSPIAVSSSSINTITSGANVATTFATIRTANGTFKIPVQSKNTATQQLILRPGTQIIAANSSQSGIINNATTTTRPATTTYIVRSPNIPSNRPIIISNSALNGPIVRPINNIQTNIKQAIPLITPNTPQKISTGTTVNAILTTTQTKSIAASISQTTATSSTTSNVVISTSGLNTTTATKNIQCVQVKTNDGRTHLLPISSFAGASGQTLQIAVNSNSATPLRLITKPADSAALKDVQGKPILVAGSNSILPQNTFILSNVSQSQKLVLQPSSSVTTVSTATTSKANATTTASKGANGKPVVSATTITTTTAPLLSPPKTATAEDKEFVLTAEVTQEIVRKALMDASLPPETSQKLMAYQRHHQEMLDSTCSSTVSPMPAIHQTLKSPLKTYSFATPTHTNSTNSNSRVSSRSSRVSRSSRYDSEDFITDFHKVDRSQHRSDEDEVTRTCRGVLKYLVDKIDKEEKRAKQKEVTEERKQKKAAQQKQKFRQNHIEILRRSIIRRKAKLNITIKSRIEKSLNLKLSKVRPLLPPTPKPAVSVAAATAAAAAKNVIAPINNNINSIKRKLEEEQVIAPSPGRTNDINATKANLNSFTTPVNTTTKNKRARVTITPSLGNNNIDSAASAALPRKAQPKISPKSSKGQELYCFCKKPYDNTFMICCDRCQDWFHGRCVGITSAEADSIAEYFCPQCEGDNSINNRNIRPLNEEDYAALLTLLKAVQSHKNAWPFLKAVDKKAVPDYYIIIKEPMDLKKIEGRLNGRKYQKLAEFIYDMSKMFDNCRLYNARTSQYYHCAETLEGFFLSKVKAFREQGS